MNELTVKEKEYLLDLVRSMNECDENILQYPSGFSKEELQEIKEGLEIGRSVYTKLLGE